MREQRNPFEIVEVEKYKFPLMSLRNRIGFYDKLVLSDFYRKENYLKASRDYTWNGAQEIITLKPQSDAAIYENGVLFAK